MISQPNERTFSGGAECKLGCAYCFAKSGEYLNHKFPNLTTGFTKIGTVLYPVCDSEVQFNIASLTAVEEYIGSSSGPLIVSLSTKAALSRKVLESLSRINDRLRIEQRGFVKLAASISTFREIDRLAFERGCSTSSDRVNALQMACESGLETGLTLKPILPQVSVDDYRRLIDLFKAVTNRVVLGGLYCFPNTAFGRITIEQYPHMVSHRKVNWLPANPSWIYVENPEATKVIAEHASATGYRVFESDIDLLGDIAAAILDSKYHSLSSPLSNNR